MRASLRLLRAAAPAKKAFRPARASRAFSALNNVPASAAVTINSTDVGKARRPQPPSLETTAPIALSGPVFGDFRDASHTELRGLPTLSLHDTRKELSAKEAEAFRADILEYFHKTFTLNEKLYEMFADTPTFFEKHERLRHPPIFYLGHTAAFFVNKLHLGQFIQHRINPELEMQMAVGVDEMSWDDLDSNSYIWPSGEEARADPERATAFVQKVLNFRRAVRMMVDETVRQRPVEWPVKKDSFWWIIMMGIEHERIHLETSSVIHRQASLEKVRPRKAFPRCELGLFDTDPDSATAKQCPENRLLPVEKGSTRLGRSWEGTSTYGWDNEFGVEKQLEVPAFAASEFLVSNKEFLSFIRDGGYSTQRFWSEEGWSWVSDMGPKAPRFWLEKDGGFHLRTLCEEVAMPWNWPVEVCHHEAAAYCKYLSEKTGKQLRLPSEGEYMRLRDGVPTDLQTSAHGPAWGAEVPGNVNLAYWASACPVDHFKSPTGFYDVVGNVWQHSASDIDVLDGFATHVLYDDFTVPTIDGLHSRIMGGSFISTGTNGATRDSRFGFRRHFYQHAGFRYVESDLPVTSNVLPYETDRHICNLLRFHFDEPRVGENFQVMLAQQLMEVLEKLGKSPENMKVVEFGCGPGRMVLELSKRGFASVHGADRTTKSFQGVVRFLEKGKLRWTNLLEGDRTHSRELDHEDLGIKNPDAVQFHQIPDFVAADTQKFRDFDMLVLAQPGALGAADPLNFLTSAHRLLKPGGIMAIGTQYEWRRGGDPADLETSGEKVVAELLRHHFKPVAKPADVPFELLRTSRVFEAGLQHVTFWQRTGDS